MWRIAQAVGRRIAQAARAVLCFCGWHRKRWCYVVKCSFEPDGTWRALHDSPYLKCDWCGKPRL